MLSDADGDIVKALGLVDDMGFGLGVRSQRFVLVLEDGVVKHVAVDEGSSDLKSTSAEATIEYLQQTRGAGAAASSQVNVCIHDHFFEPDRHTLILRRIDLSLTMPPGHETSNISRSGLADPSGRILCHYQRCADASIDWLSKDPIHVRSSSPRSTTPTSMRCPENAMIYCAPE